MDGGPGVGGFREWIAPSRGRGWGSMSGFHVGVPRRVVLIGTGVLVSFVDDPVNRYFPIKFGYSPRGMIKFGAFVMIVADLESKPTQDPL
jgi:hypothetical protein